MRLHAFCHRPITICASFGAGKITRRRHSWPSLPLELLSPMPSTACRRRSGAATFPRRRPPAPDSPEIDRPPNDEGGRSRAPGLSFSSLDRFSDLRTRCASIGSSARRRPLSFTRGRCSCLVPPVPRSGAAAPRPAPRSASVLASSPPPPVQDDPLNQSGPKPVGQVTGGRRVVLHDVAEEVANAGPTISRKATRPVRSAPQVRSRSP